MTSHVLTPPLIDRLIPVRAKIVRIPLQVVVGIAFLALLAQLRVEIGPVPITGQTLGVLLMGAAYGTGLGSITALGYLLVGGLGLSVFAGGGAGWATLSGATGGYLLGFVPAAALVGYLAQRGFDRSVTKTALAMVLGNIVIYLTGLAWLYPFAGQLAPEGSSAVAWVLSAGLWPFIPGDVLKLMIAAGLVPGVRRALGDG